MAFNVSSMLAVQDYSYLFNNSSKKQNSINQLWSGYSSYASNAANSLAAISEVRQGASAVVDSYNEAKDAFYTEFDDTMSTLKDAANKADNYNFNVGKDAITTEEVTDKNGKTVTQTTYSKELQGALDTVKNLVNSYNDSISFFQSYSEVSPRLAKMASNFGDTTYRASIYESIGISVGKDGTLSIDEESLAQAIVDNPNKVSRIVGDDNLAGKAEQHIDTANAQRSRLFPDAKSMLGSQLEEAALYTGSAYINMQMISNIGNLVNMMT